MSRYKQGYSESKDANQIEIVNDLVNEGFHVETGHHDILIYTTLNCHQTEIKAKSPFRKNGRLISEKIRKSQYRMLCQANDSYSVIWNSSSIITWLTTGYSAEKCGIITPSLFKKNHKRWLTRKKLNQLRQEKWWNLG